MSESGTQLMIPRAVADTLPAMVRNELAQMPAQSQDEFVEEYERRKKGLGMAYLCSLLYCHYAYVGRAGMTGIMWLVALVTLGIGALIWWVVDLFRMPGIVGNHNSDMAVDVLRNFKAIHGG